MKTGFKFYATLALAVICFITLPSFFSGKNAKPRFKFPYKQAGLTERQAAAHLLNRFTYGATPGQIDEVVKMGLEKWFQQQLDGKLPDDSLNGRLAGYDALNLTNKQVLDTYPRPPIILRMAIKDGYIDKDSVNKQTDKKMYRDKLEAYMNKMGFKPERDLYRQFISQKILRAAYSNNQLHEVLTDFWFNHFNVAFVKNDCAQFIPAYERDVIRPNVTGKFETLLLATAKSPAMLMYLDNFSSTKSNDPKPGKSRKTYAAAKNTAQPGADIMMSDMEAMQQADAKNQPQKPRQGLNENYAREVMELHTMGVDGGYTQNDVTQAARVLTGWTVYPLSDVGYTNARKKALEKLGEERMEKQGYVHDGDFLFAANRHDNGEKVVLGKKFPANGGYEEGVTLLSMLAHHPSTAKFISRKIAVRFVNDNPPQSLIDKMAQTFSTQDGDIAKVLITMVTSPEFWSKDALREKTKSPFELAMSAVRTLHADIQEPYQLYSWINKMGQRMYYYQAPTGFPDRGQYWINTGSLLSRMNFGLALASQRVPGVKVDLAALNNHREPESTEQALLVYSKLIMPERNLDETVKHLTPLLNTPDLGQKVAKAASKANANNTMTMTGNKDDVLASMNDEKPAKKASVNTNKNNNQMLAQVVGIIVGSPEFQRR
ncbi:DUF1800 domain-containing protein [Pedobacter sp. BS3]|uniref:DUF1800 domain-containing protein n=1 Tax=Pedobacter sp. BS3 TaxID=2567937 RepID=UPI0011ED53C1|nr:DUF1800 domain-containing protein [Pedobacter sp. BS3]TZF84808.1 DUF1800 domain-containing protein [Pedobacter sp. BS3]